MTRILHFSDIHLEDGFAGVPRAAFLNKRLLALANLRLVRGRRFARARAKMHALEAFAEAEKIFRAHDGRPHWAKRHTLTTSDLHALYPQAAKFCAVRDSIDPPAKFANAHLSQLFDIKAKS